MKKRKLKLCIYYKLEFLEKKSCPSQEKIGVSNSFKKHILY